MSGERTVHTGSGEVYGVTNFTITLGPSDWRIYWADGTSEGCLLRFTGPDAEVKAKAVAIILNGWR